MSEQGISQAPWTDLEVDCINSFQRGGAFHPFMCDCHHHPPMVAFNDALRCEECGFEQTWVHAFMAEGIAITNFGGPWS
jgi:hypothetical protein